MQHESKKAAQLVMLQIWHQKRHEKTKLPRRAYQCPRCEKWHLTSMQDPPTK